MADIRLRDSQEFRIKELIIVTKGGRIDISEIYEEINIHDSIFMPVMSGKIMINDSVGLTKSLAFDGSESLLMHIEKSPDSNEVFNFKRSFRIYKLSDRSDLTTGSETYVLSFVSDELIYSDQQRITQAYETTYSDTVDKILSDYLKVPRKKIDNGVFESSSGIKKFIIPNLRPLEAIEWCTKRSVDQKQSPCYLFYENITGFNFVSLSWLLKQNVIDTIEYSPKNLRPESLSPEIGSSIRELSLARSFEVVSQVDYITKTRSGVNAGKFIGFDPITRTILIQNIGYNEHYNSMEHANETPNLTVIPNRENKNNTDMYDSKKTVYAFSASRKTNKYVQENDPTSLSKLDDVENYLLQRQAIMNNLMERRVKLTMPGNFQLSSGFNIDLSIPAISIKEKGSDNKDLTLSGKYIIVGSRHIIGYEKFQTIIEVATTSSSIRQVLRGTDQQTREILEY